MNEQCSVEKCGAPAPYYLHIDLPEAEIRATLPRCVEHAQEIVAVWAASSARSPLYERASVRAYVEEGR